MICKNCGEHAICKNCGADIELGEFKRLCPRKISWTDSQKGGMRHFDTKRKKGKTDIGDRVYNWIDSKKIDYLFTKTEILNDLDLLNKTSGDDVYQSLNFWVCTGVIQRIEHVVNKKYKEGSMRECKYLIKDINHPETCPYFSRNKKDKFECKCDKSRYMTSSVGS
jgi:hypothetical protein